MKTAEEFKNDWLNGFELDINQINDLMIEFTKYHVKHALEKASETAEVVAHQYIEVALDEEYNKEAVLKAYNLENIK